MAESSSGSVVAIDAVGFATEYAVNAAPPESINEKSDVAATMLVVEPSNTTAAGDPAAIVGGVTAAKLFPAPDWSAQTVTWLPLSVIPKSAMRASVQPLAGMYVNPAESVAEPPGPVTTTSLFAAVCAGVLPVAVVSLTTARLVIAAPPIPMPVRPPPLKPVPRIVTAVPPADDPNGGEIAVTVGAAGPDETTALAGT